jgi:hypothetical protein
VSTTFDVYPRTPQLPTFGALLERSTAELHHFLASVGVEARPPIHLRLQRCDDHAHLPFALADEAWWGDDVYAWFMVGDVPGGTDAYYDANAAAIAEQWQGEFDDSKCMRLEPLIRECVKVGHRWWFRRSVGQPAVVNIAYGLIAASLADMTGGFIYSNDSAWDWQRMPALPAEFFGFYFRPEQALEENFREWSQRCIRAVAEELQGSPT